MPSPIIGGPISKQAKAELHTHTTFSDGVLTPEQLVAETEGKNLAALAVTDHDIVGGVAPARRAARDLQIEIVAGVELSTNLRGHELHMLGLFIDDDDEELIACTQRCRDLRHQRAAEIVDRLNDLGCAVGLDAVEAVAADGSIGRPHIARALVDEGSSASLDDAFRRYIGVGRPAFVPKPTVGVAEVIGVVHRAGGVAILAHPASSRVGEPEIRELAELGMDGFEVDHPKHGAAARRSLRALIEETGLLPSGGSDFHGPGVGDTRLGDHAVSLDWLEGLRRGARRHRDNRGASKESR